MPRKSKHSGPKYANGNYKSYQKAYDKLRIKNRAWHNKINYEAGTYGNHDGLDNARKSNGRVKKESASKNRSYNGHGKRSRYSP